MLIYQLPEPFKSMALANQKLQGNEPDESKDLYLNNKEDGGFTWVVTQEPTGFWESIWRSKYPEITPGIKANYPDIFPVENKVPKDLSRMEAIQAMVGGAKVKHRFFSDNEWVTMEGFDFLFEDGVKCQSKEMWRDRTGGYWETGWGIVEEPVENKEVLVVGKEAISGEQGKEWILCAAIDCEGAIVSGFRHSTCYATLKMLLPNLKHLPDRGQQGFLTSTGRFVDRKEAYLIAKVNNQIKYGASATDEILISENLY